MVTIVLLPGMDGTGALFAEVVAALGSNYHAIVVPYPKNLAWGYQELTTFARNYLPKDKPFILVGESFSGPVAIALAASRPAGLTGLVLCCTFARNPLPLFKPLNKLVSVLPVKSQFIDALIPFLFGRFATASLRSAYRQALARIDVDVLRIRTQEVLKVDYSEKLKQVNVPVLYLRAAHDRIVPCSAVRHITATAPFTQTITLDGPHMLLQVMPAQTASMIKKFVEGTVAAFHAPAEDKA